MEVETDLSGCMLQKYRSHRCKRTDFRCCFATSLIIKIKVVTLFEQFLLFAYYTALLEEKLLTKWTLNSFVFSQF